MAKPFLFRKKKTLGKRKTTKIKSYGMNGGNTRRNIVNKKSVEMKPLVKKGEEKLNFAEIFGLTFFGLAFIFGIWGIFASPMGFYWFSALSLLMSFLAFMLHRRFKGELRSWTKYLIPAAVFSALVGLMIATVIQIPL